MDPDRKKALQILRTAKGQIEKTISMIEDERYCIDISNQIMAGSGLLKTANKHILRQHLNHCVANSLAGNDQADIAVKTEEVIRVLEKLIGD